MGVHAKPLASGRHWPGAGRRPVGKVARDRRHVGGGHRAVDTLWIVEVALALLALVLTPIFIGRTVKRMTTTFPQKPATDVNYYTQVARFRAEWPMTTNPFDLDGYDVTAALVDRVDNQGEPCQLCAEIDAPIEVTVTGLNPATFTRHSVDCCVRCALVAVAETLATEHTTVEVAR
jgi:hypothetical protein